MSNRGFAETVYLSVQLAKLDGARAIGGVIFGKRGEQGGKIESFKIGSVYLTDVYTGYQAIYALIAECLKELPMGTRLLIARSTAPQFRRYQKIQRKVNVLSDVEVKVMHDAGQPHDIRVETMGLANDALKRERTIFTNL